MTDKIAVSLKDISKKYRLFNSPKERFLEALHPFNKKYHKPFWALNGITMEIIQGQTVGIIGRNGSGKSTLLQIICSIVTPTTGEISIKGRISALLELGAGFNPEFSGRENVFINGALMGFSRKEMVERMSIIEDFADIGEFIDQPVKVYSSGMFVRLAFACAINVDPDILIVDEALAVGDAKFQYKCFQKFSEYQKSGKTIIFVTHDMGAVVKHCDYAFLLEKGVIITKGKPNDIVNRYYEFVLSDNQQNTIEISRDVSTECNEKIENDKLCVYHSKLDLFLVNIPFNDNCINNKSYNKNEYRFGDKRAEIIDYIIVNNQNYESPLVLSGDIIEIYFRVNFFQTIEYPIFGFSIKTLDGIVVYATNTDFNKISISPIQEGETIVCMYSIKLQLNAGHYFIDLGVAEKMKAQEIPLDIRYGLIHIQIKEKSRFDGLVEFESVFKEISRKN